MKEQQTSNGTTLTRPREAVLTRWDPWKELAETRRQMDTLFGPVFGVPAFTPVFPTELVEKEPEVDIHETGEAFQVLVSLPGYMPEQIDVQATETTLTIIGERPALFAAETVKTHRNAGLSGSSHFQFTYTLPVEIDPKKIQANFKCGILQIQLPKIEVAKPRSVKINVQPVA